MPESGLARIGEIATRYGPDITSVRCSGKGRPEQVDAETIRKLLAEIFPKARIARGLWVSRMTVCRALKDGDGSPHRPVCISVQTLMTSGRIAQMGVLTEVIYDNPLKFFVTTDI